MKQCTKCGETKPLSEFYALARMKDGHFNKCKVCFRKDVIANRAARIEYYRAYDRERFQKDPDRRASSMEQAKARAKANPAAMAMKLLAYQQKYPEKAAAQNAVNNALRDGKLSRGTCCEVCWSDKRIQAHHPDYSKPLHVWWLCTACHNAIHRLQREALRSLHAKTHRSRP